MDTAVYPLCSHTGFTGVNIFVCELSGYSFLAGTRNKSALESAIALVTLSGFFGCPDALHTDGGPEYRNEILRQFNVVTGAKHTFSLPNAPNTNGIAERGIGTVNHVMRALVIDSGRANSWGLILPLVQHAVNNLPRKHTLCSPNDFIFASLRPSSDDAIMATLPAQLANPSNELNLLNEEHLANSYIFRALAFQQSITNKIHEYHEMLLRNAADSPPTQGDSLAAGDLVLIDWTGKSDSSPPTKLHPTLRGPYIVRSVHNNTMSLYHLHNPPPADQPSLVTWSKHARAYKCEMDFDRSQYDPSAAIVPLNSSAYGIDCILSHQRRTDLSKIITAKPDFSPADARYQLYEVRYHWSSAPHFLRVAWRHYEDISHTMALDNYLLGNPEIHSHSMTAFSPPTWSTLRKKNLSSQDPVPFHERDL
jgi:hypothetical protein